MQWDERVEDLGRSHVICGFTGHRDIDPIHRPYIVDALIGHLLKLKPDRVLVGMAVGGDTLCAYVCLSLLIPFEAYVPFDGQESRWPFHIQAEYRRLILRAAAVKVITPGPYSAAAMHVRNAAIVRDCNTLIALYDGRTVKSGTYRCVREAERVRRPIVRINPFDLDGDAGVAYCHELGRSERRR